MCGSHCSPRSEGASDNNHTITRGKGDFPLAPVPVVDIFGGHSFHCPTLPDDSGRDTRGEDAGSTGDKTGVGTIQATTNGRLAHASFGLSTLYRLESVSGECSSGLDDVSVMRSPLKSDDRNGRHSDKGGTDNCTTSVSTTMPWMWKDDALATRLTRRRRFSVAVGFSCAKKDGARTTYCGITCFTVCALVFGGATSGESDNANGCRISGTFQPRPNQNRISHWNNFSLFRLLESRARKLSELYSSCFQIKSTRSRCPTQSRNCRPRCRRFEPPGIVPEGLLVEPQSVRQ